MKAHDDRLLEGFFDRSNGDLETKQLQERLAADAELAAEFDFQSKIGKAFQSAEHQKMKKILQDEEATISSPMQVAWLNPRRLMAAAAVLAGLAVFFWTRDRPPAALDSQAVFAQNFQTFNAEHDIFLQKIGVRTAESRGEETLAPEPADQKFVEPMQAALEKYRAKDFAGAAADFEKIKTDDPAQAVAVNFYLGVCQNAESKFAEAEKTLAAATAESGFHQAPAIWQLALAQLAQGKITDAKINLEKYLASPGGIPERTKARAILEKLK